MMKTIGSVHQCLLFVDVIRHTRACRAVGTLIVPEWASAFFWPLLKPRPSRFASFVVDVVRLPRRSDLIIPGPGQKIFYRGKPSVFFGCPKFSMLALRIDFRLTSRTCLCLHCSPFACGLLNGPCVACVCYVCRAAWFVSVAALMRVLSVVLVVYHELALEVRCRSYRASCCLP